MQDLLGGQQTNLPSELIFFSVGPWGNSHFLNLCLGLPGFRVKQNN